MNQAPPPVGRPPASSAATARTSTTGSRLPWSLVAILSVACLVLLTVVGLRDQEIATLKTQVAATPTAGAATTTAAAQIDPSAAIRALARADADDPRAIGAMDAPVVILEFADFRCPYCAVWANQTLPELLPYVESGSVRIEFHDMAIFGDDSELAAVAARAAGQQGKFWEFSAALYAAAPPQGGHPAIGTKEVMQFAEEAEVPDLAAFEATMSDEALFSEVQQETAAASAAGITGVPFFVVNSTVINGAQPTDTFLTVIEQLGGRA